MVGIEVDKGYLQSSTLQFNFTRYCTEYLCVQRFSAVRGRCSPQFPFVPSQEEGALKLHRLMRGCSAALGACCVHGLLCPCCLL